MLALVEIGGLGPTVVGLVFTIGSIGFVVGAVLADRIADRLGVGRAAVAGLILVAVTILAMAIAPAAFYAVAITAAFFVHGGAAMVYNVASLSVRQAIPPRPLLGRVNAAIRVVSWASFPVGALLGGLLATAIGLRPAIALAGLIALTGIVPLVLSPFASTRTLADVEPASRSG